MTKQLSVIIPLAVLFTPSCSSNPDKSNLLNCRNVAPATEARPNEPAFVPITVPVAVRGQYVPPFAGDVGATQATTIDLAALRLAPGDYIGLKAQGGWRRTGSDANVYKQLGAVFLDGAGRHVSPGKFGQEAPFKFFSPSPTSEFGVTDKDFAIPADRETIVRIPAGSSKLALSVGDWFVSDNCPPAVTGSNPYNCGALSMSVVLSKPNRPSTSVAGGADVSSLEPDMSVLKLPQRSLTYPVATGFSASPVVTVANSATDGQWRGNYPPTGTWLPERSRYDAPRPIPGDANRRHWGWDIFAPEKSKLIAPAWPAEVRYTTGTGYGKVAIVAFTWRSQPYWLVYAHLNAQVGADRTITGPEVIGLAGCTDNTEGCGTPLANGTRTDHVHVGLFRVPNPNGNVADVNACDPAMILPWQIR